MPQQQIEKICKEFLPRYINGGADMNLKYLEKLARKTIDIASKRYEKLQNPRTCNLDTYIKCSVREKLISDLIYKTWDKRTPLGKQKNILARAFSDYFKAVPIDKNLTYSSLWKKVNKDLLEKGTEFVEWLYIPQLIDKGEKPFAEILKAREQLAKKQGFKSSLELQATEIYKIPQKDMQVFLKNKNKVIKYCQKQIPKIKLHDWFYSQFNNQCFICELSKFPQLKYPDEVFDFVAKEYPILNKFRHKIKIKEGKSPNVTYLVKSDNFLINISKNLNNRHHTIELIHELSHVIEKIEKLKKNIDPLYKGKYIAELDATRIYLKLLKKLSPQGYQAKIAGILANLHEVIFQIEAHKNPNQNLPTLYAKLFKHCFPKFKQKKAYAYLINADMITRPFRTLPHAVAYVKFLKEYQI